MLEIIYTIRLVYSEEYIICDYIVLEESDSFILHKELCSVELENIRQYTYNDLIRMGNIKLIDRVEQFKIHKNREKTINEIIEYD